jgi:hypothetical protein
VLEARHTGLVAIRLEVLANMDVLVRRDNGIREYASEKYVLLSHKF